MRRSLLVFMIALVVVVAGALLIGLADDEDPGSDETKGSVLAALEGKDDPAAAGDIGEIGVLSPAGRVEPATEEWEALLPRLKEVAEAAPDDRNAQRKLALAYYNLGRLEEARRIYQRLLAREEDPVLRNRLGNTLRDMGDAWAAEEAYRRAIQEDPTLVPPYINLAELLWRQGKDQDALAIVEKGLEAVPEENAAALQEAGRVLAGEE